MKKENEMRNEIVLKREFLDPMAAKRILEINTNNRPVNKNYVDFLAKEMENGYWHEEKGETIQISKNGILIDGQHRLLALIKSGCSFNFNVAYNVRDDGFKTTDQHRKRTIQQILEMSGVKNSAIIASIVPRIDLYTRHNITRESLLLTTTKGGQYYTPKIVEALYYEDIEFYDNLVKIASKFSDGGAPKGLLSRQVIGSAYGIVSRKYPHFDVYAFFEKIFTGFGITKKSNEYFIRKELIEIKMNPLARLSVSTQLTYLIHYANITNAGKHYTRNRYTSRN